MSRLRNFFVKFWESDEDICTVVTHGAVTNLMAVMFTGGFLKKIL